ncbi:MAG: hypothetical protein RR842_08195 [Gordonibacter sp.]|uniref:hypothetical protein n=1 Tax=Gordonibacter sp. TaxID=1968902 RepID=UPI002FCB4555
MTHDREVMRYCVNDYLLYVRSLDATMRAIEGDIAYQNARLHLLGVSYDGGGGAANKDALPDGVVKLMELRDKWSEEYTHCAEDLEFARVLCKPAHVSRWIVWLHTVDRLTWEGVSRRVGYSRRQTIHFAEAGTREIYYAMPELWRRDPIPNAAAI